MANVASAIIGEAGGLLSAGLDLATSSYRTKQSVKASKELMDYQNDLNIANWQRQNAYNAPAEEIKRLRAAGINPDLFYQNGTSSLGASPISSPSASASSAEGIHTNFGAPTQSSMLLDAQTKLLESQTAKNYADANQTNALTPWVSKQVQSELSLNEANTKVLNETVEKIRNESELLRWQGKISHNSFKIADALRDSDIATKLKENGASQKQSSVIIDMFADVYAAQLRLAVAQCYASYVQSDAAASNASTARGQLSLDTLIRNGELEVKRAQQSLDKYVKNNNVNLQNLQNEWRTMLKDVPLIGDAVHGLLSIPASWFGNLFK
ncbi:DNA pilot protein [Sigmofec virus UA08Rod_4411]|uniref:DNA pilot protein n=1 Tax=Sigmofec virus UA08Rod_4411 TaxID=2929401 RepID=A0A976R824_9VIRU|nr:DNA pilot protein [Sigmofec virus UA08Rod_4411]